MAKYTEVEHLIMITNILHGLGNLQVVLFRHLLNLHLHLITPLSHHRHCPLHPHRMQK